jgi:hypothetical protein
MAIHEYFMGLLMAQNGILDETNNVTHFFASPFLYIREIHHCRLSCLNRIEFVFRVYGRLNMVSSYESSRSLESLINQFSKKDGLEEQDKAQP